MGTNGEIKWKKEIERERELNFFFVEREEVSAWTDETGEGLFEKPKFFILFLIYKKK